MNKNHKAIRIVYFGSRYTVEHSFNGNGIDKLKTDKKEEEEEEVKTKAKKTNE